MFFVNVELEVFEVVFLDDLLVIVMVVLVWLRVVLEIIECALVYWLV